MERDASWCAVSSPAVFLLHCKIHYSRLFGSNTPHVVLSEYCGTDRQGFFLTGCAGRCRDGLGSMGNPFLPGVLILRSLCPGLPGMARTGGTGMNLQGWVFMLIVWGIVGSLFLYSFYRILFDGRVGNKIEQNNTGKKKKKKCLRD